MGGGQRAMHPPSQRRHRALHTKTATETNLSHTQHRQHYRGRRNIPPKSSMTISTYGTALRLEISTRLISVDGGFATALDTTDHVGRRSRRLPMRLALLGEADAVTLHGRMSDLGLTTDCDFGGMTEAWQQAGSGGYALIFMLEPSSTRSEEIAAVTNVDFLTSGQDDLAAHGLRNRVCLRFGCTPEKNRIKNLSAQKTLVATAESTGREGSEASARTEGVWWYCASAALEFANIHVQDQLAYGNEDLRQPDIEQHAGDGRPVGCAPVVPWITALVCSSYVSGAGIYYGRVFLPLGCQCQLPCREARFSGSGRFAGPALRLVSGCPLFARKRGTPGTIARPPGTLLSMAEAPDLSSAPTDATMDAAKSGTRYSATVASFAPVVPWITALVCSSYVSGAGIYYGRVFLPLGCQCQLPCREARFSGCGRFAGPALRLVSGCPLFARKRGTPGTIARPPGTLLSMAEAPDLSSAPTDATMDAAKSGTRYSATVASFHLFTGWALFCGYVGANFTFWRHSKRSQQQEWHRLSWKSLAGGRRSATPASCLVSGSHSVAWACDPSLWYASYRPAPQELMDAEASSLEHRLEYGGQL